MNIIQAIFLGVVQGVTEVLPISSSGHLIIFPWLFNFSDPGLSFDVSLHLGTLLSILIIFKDDISKILEGGLSSIVRRNLDDFYQKLFFFVIIATIPGIFVGVFLQNWAENIFRHPLLIAITLIFFGLVLFISDRLDVRPKKLKDITLFDTIIIGVSQAIAIIPGVSRSGITISAGLFRKLTREDAARFSFIISIPIILGAGLYQLRYLTLETLISPVFVSGFLAAFISSLVSIKFLMRFVKTRSFNIFVYYRIILALLIVIIFMLK